VYEASQGSFVETEAGGPVKTWNSGAAGPANSVFVERMRVQERSPAQTTEVFSFQRFRSGETGRTYRDSGPAVECDMTETAVSREKK
jgi:hypothetical protein